MSATYAITGIKAGSTPDGGVPIRRDVDEWWLSNNVVDANQKSLFIQAMSLFEQIDVTQKLSYFQIAGVHGQPLVPWDENTKPVTEGRGYCTHGSVLFPSWHRPYMLLFEQRLHEIMTQEVIPKYAQEDQADLKHAANLWRLPYWDWASSKPDWNDPSNKSKYGPNVPKLVTEETVEIRTPTGSATVRNPFWDFQMPLVNGKRPNMGQYGIQDTQGEPFQDCVATSKQPPTDDPDDVNYQADWVDGDVQDNRTIRANLRKESGVNALPEVVYRLFTDNYFSTYDAFASTEYKDGQSSSEHNSLEGIHNFIHDDTGGLGHMAVVPVAAFDPIFWLHHCNVDRLYAIWQATHPDKWFDPDPKFNAQRLDTGTWSNKVNELDTPQTPLTLFHRDEKATYWTSDDARDFMKLGYSYTELQPWLSKYKIEGKFSQAAYQKDVLAQIDRLYGTTGRAFLQPRSADAVQNQSNDGASVQAQKVLQASANEDTTSKSGHQHSSAHAGHALLKSPVNDGQAKAPDFLVNVLYEKFALNGQPFAVHIFLGDAPAHAPYTFGPESTQIGQVYNFSTPSTSIGRNAETGCANCHNQEQARVKSTGQVVLTNALLALATGRRHPSGVHLRSLDKTDVEECLKRHLHWRVSRRGRDVPLSDLPSLKVSVAMGTATHFVEDGVLSRYEDYEVLYPITEGRPGGANPGDQS